MKKLDNRRSYTRTAQLATAAFFLSVIAAVGLALAGSTGVAFVGTLVSLAIAALLAGTCLVLNRDRRQRTGQPDLFEVLNASRAETVLATRQRHTPLLFQRLRARFAGSPFVVGETVRVKPLHAIRNTLDERGCVEGLPFLPEMERFAGKTFRVFRCIDKIYDYGGDKTLRRMRDAVSLAGVRCSGSEHGGCQAECSLIWKTQWLEPCAGTVERHDPAESVGNGHGQAEPFGSERYVCQYTELVAASRPYRALEGWSKDVVPLISGNVAPLAFAVAMLTRLFNRVQSLRGGAGFPGLTPQLSGRTPLVRLNLKAGDRVRILDRDAVSETLDSTSRNRGLWFDQDMTKHLQRPYRVKGRVERIIDDATGKLIEMKYPCILLDDVVSSGEHLRFCPQSDYQFWREAWLERIPPSEQQAETAESIGEGARSVG